MCMRGYLRCPSYLLCRVLVLHRLVACIYVYICAVVGSTGFHHVFVIDALEDRHSGRGTARCLAQSQLQPPRSSRLFPGAILFGAPARRFAVEAAHPRGCAKNEYTDALF